MGAPADADVSWQRLTMAIRRQPETAFAQTMCEVFAEGDHTTSTSSLPFSASILHSARSHKGCAAVLFFSCIFGNVRSLRQSLGVFLDGGELLRNGGVRAVHEVRDANYQAP